MRAGATRGDSGPRCPHPVITHLVAALGTRDMAEPAQRDHVCDTGDAGGGIPAPRCTQFANRLLVISRFQSEHPQNVAQTGFSPSLSPAIPASPSASEILSCVLWVVSPAPGDGGTYRAGRCRGTDPPR